MNVRASIMAKLDRMIFQLRRANKTYLKNMATKVEAQVQKEGYMKKIIEDRFAHGAEYGKYGGKWKLRKKEKPWPILFLTGNLFWSTVRAVSGPGTFTFRLFGPIRFRNRLRYVNVRYGKYHQNGVPSRNLPARRFISDPNKQESMPAKKRGKTLFVKELDRRLKVR